MHGGLPYRPGYAAVPQLEPGAVRHAIDLRGMGSWRGSEPDEGLSLCDHPPSK